MDKHATASVPYHLSKGPSAILRGPGRTTPMQRQGNGLLWKLVREYRVALWADSATDVGDNTLES